MNDSSRPGTGMTVMWRVKSDIMGNRNSVGTARRFSGILNWTRELRYWLLVGRKLAGKYRGVQPYNCVITSQIRACAVIKLDEVKSRSMHAANNTFPRGSKKEK